MHHWHDRDRRTGMHPCLRTPRPQALAVTTALRPQHPPLGALHDARAASRLKTIHMESDGAAPMLMPQANDGVDFAFASQQIIAASAQMFAAPQQNFQKTLAGLLGMIEQQQKQIKRLQGETDSLKDEMGEMAPRLDGLDNQVDKIAEQVKTLEFNLSGDDDADQGAEPEKEKPPAMDNAIYERLAALETKEEKLQERERLMEKQAREEIERLRAEKADADARAEKLAQEALEAANEETARALAELERMKLEVEASRAEAEAAEQKASEVSTLASASQAEVAQQLELERVYRFVPARQHGSGGWRWACGAPHIPSTAR